MMSTTTNEQMSTEEYSSSRHSTPNSSGGDKQFQFGSNNNIERYKRMNFKNFFEKIFFVEDQDKILEQVPWLNQPESIQTDFLIIQKLFNIYKQVH